MGKRAVTKDVFGDYAELDRRVRLLRIEGRSDHGGVHALTAYLNL